MRRRQYVMKDESVMMVIKALDLGSSPRRSVDSRRKVEEHLKKPTLESRTLHYVVPRSTQKFLILL